jgi:hypothetical protein
LPNLNEFRQESTDLRKSPARINSVEYISSNDAGEDNRYSSKSAETSGAEMLGRRSALIDQFVDEQLEVLASGTNYHYSQIMDALELLIDTHLKYVVYPNEKNESNEIEQSNSSCFGSEEKAFFSPTVLVPQPSPTKSTFNNSNFNEDLLDSNEKSNISIKTKSLSVKDTLKRNPSLAKFVKMISAKEGKNKEKKPYISTNSKENDTSNLKRMSSFAKLKEKFSIKKNGINTPEKFEDEGSRVNSIAVDLFPKEASTESSESLKRTKSIRGKNESRCDVSRSSSEPLVFGEMDDTSAINNLIAEYRYFGGLSNTTTAKVDIYEDETSKGSNFSLTELNSPTIALYDESCENIAIRTAFDRNQDEVKVKNYDTFDED